MKKIVQFLIISIILFSLASISYALPVMDQAYEPVSPNISCDLSITRYQTFTVGVSGLLTQIDVLIQKLQQSNISFGLHETDTSGSPVSSSLASAGINSSDIPDAYDWVSIDLSAEGIFVNSGDILAIRLANIVSLSGYTLWHGSDSNPYDGGQSFYQVTTVLPPTTTLYDDPLVDLGFRTFVDSDISAIPEPTTILLLFTGLIGLVGIKKKFKA